MTSHRILLAAALLSACVTEEEADVPDIGAILDEADGGKGDRSASELPELVVTNDQRVELAAKGTTCPFARAAILLGQVKLHGELAQPLANTADIARLGNVGGGDLGRVLRLFAAINHNKLVGPGGATTRPVPDGTFGAWFPGSHGAHPGHSGILMGDPSNVGSGQLSPEKLDRLTALGTLYPDGKRYISREQIGAFIAENVKADPTARGFNRAGMKSLSIEIAKLLVRAARGGDSTLLEDTAHLLVTSNDLVNSSGEFGLLFTRFADGQDANGNPLVSTAAIDALFRQGVFPAGWDKKPAFAKQWIKDTLVITKAAVFASWGF
jgi:hypothetical protein